MIGSISDSNFKYGFTVAPTIVNLSTSTNRNGSDLAEGWYEVSSDVDAFFLVGGSGVEATTSSIPLYAKTPVLVKITSPNLRIAGIVASGTGKLYITDRRRS